MRSVILCLLLAITVDANIIFQHAPLKCNPLLPARKGCFRGQSCSPSGTCEIRSKEVPARTTPSRQLLLQRPHLPASQESSLISTSLAARPSRKPVGKVRGIRGIRDIGDGSSGRYEHGSPNLSSASNSQANLNSRAGSEPILETPPGNDSPVSSASRNGSITVDGLCGIRNGFTKCGGWHTGPCCSGYGFCGRTTSHCLYGCQSGPCLNQTGLAPFDPVAADEHPKPGEFKVVGQSGVPAMAAGLMPNGRVFFLDKVENYTQLQLDNGQYAYSAEYNPITNEVVALPYKTNAFCSGGAFLADGRVIAVGGNGPLDFDPTVGDGFTGIRYLKRSPQDNQWDGLPWAEPGNQLSSPRWYVSVQSLADGRLFVASGSANGLNPTKLKNNNPTYEILDRSGYSSGFSVNLAILEDNQPYYMYPFIHLLKDGTLFIFVARSAEIFDVRADTTIRRLYDLPGDYRTYPNTGGSVLLPLSSEGNWAPDILVCGGGSYQGVESPTDASCGRIQPLSEDPKWEMDAMPNGRGMVEGTLLPDGTVVWLNGCNRGAQGFGVAKDPIFEAWIYDPRKPLGERWATGASSKVARMYHSVALLLLDGTVMIAGSNPVEQPIFRTDPDDPLKAFPTEFRVEIYTPPYLDGSNASRRPTDVKIPTKYLPANGHLFHVKFSINVDAEDVKVVLYHGGFVTHSVHMGHRMLYLDIAGFIPGRATQTVTAKMPPSPSIAPPGPYVIYVVVDGIPSVGQFVTVE